jgi:5'-3' exonuclease
MPSKETLKDRVYLVDASIYIFRAWFSYQDEVTDSSGHIVNAVFGYADFLTRLYPAYKANREPAPAELKYQFDLCRRLTRALGIAEYSSDRFEADDILGTMASMMRAEQHPVTVITSDKDLTQLLQHEQDQWWDYARNIKLDHDGVLLRFGVKPKQIADMLALAGDTVDNIPGIPGIGPKTAAGLLQRYDCLDGIYNNLHQVENCGLRGSKRIKQLLIKHEDDARLARQLTVVSDLVPLQSEPVHLSWQGVEKEQVEEISEDLGFSSFRRRYWLDMV